MISDDVLRVVIERLGSGMPVVDVSTELAGVLVDLSGRADFLTAVDTIDTVVGQAAYDAPEDLKNIYEVAIDGGAVLEKKTYRDYLKYLEDNATAAASEPLYYALRHSKITLWPVPDAVYTVNVDSSIYHPAVFTDILFGPEFYEAIYEGVLAAVYAGKLNRQLTMSERSLSESEEITLKFYERYPQAKLHSERYEQEIDKLMGNVEADAAVVEYRDI